MVVTPNEWMMATVALALAALRLVRAHQEHAYVRALAHIIPTLVYAVVYIYIGLVPAPVAERMPLVRWSMVFLLASFALDNIMRIHLRWLWARARAEWREWRRGWILPR